MKNYWILLVLLGGLTLLNSCQKDTENEAGSDPDSPRIKNSSKLVTPKDNSTYKIGDPISFEITSSIQIDSIVLESGSQQATFTNATFEWNSDMMRTGNQRLKLMVYHGADRETHYPRIKFLSDITPEKFTYRVLNTYPHSTESYTQGLFFMNDTLIESTGQRGKSRIMKVDYLSGEAHQIHSLQDQYFGEGSTYWNDQIYMLTYTAQLGFIYDSQLNQTGTFRYGFPEGWGLTTMGDTLIASDGTETLHFLNPNDLSEFGSLQAYDDQDKVDNLNELELIDGLLYANIYQENIIVVIDPKSGKMLREIDMSGILSPAESSKADVLNGIALHPETNSIYVTGKLWPKLFQVEFIKK